MNTKPKQGTVFRVFRGHVMDIPADYNSKSFATKRNFRPPNWVPEPVSMLPIPMDWVAMQECVGNNAKGPRLANARPSEKGGFAAKVAVCNIQGIPGHAAKVAARNIQEIPGGNIKEISGHQLRVTYKKCLHQVDVRTPPVEQNQPAPIKMVSDCV